ncbi:LysR family transcriptional regulator [Kitasatospora sp. NPDC028055]|uniref:LysR family transcriptional regulator n=1 Tax=Kitasatospora sp. NPDC028055 TaxID=3155653 RepID=UPI0033CC0E80
MPLSPRVPDLPSLELLLAVARLGSLGRAAREVGISQPAASARMRVMETRIGVGLLERSPNGSRLTSAGVLVTGWAGRVLEAAGAMDAGIEALRGERDDRLRVAASLTVAEHLLPGWLVALREERPDTVVSLSADNSGLVAEKVLRGEVDLGFVESATVPAGLDAVVVARDELVVVTAPQHAWARRSRVAPEELAAARLILREAGSGARQVLTAVLAPHGGPAGPLLELPSSTAVKAAAVAGAGPAVLSRLAVEEDLRARRLVAVQVTGVDLSRSLRAVWPSGRRPQGPARDLLSMAGRAVRRGPGRTASGTAYGSGSASGPGSARR